MKVGDYVRTNKGTLQPPQIARIKSMQKDSGYHNLYYIELDHNLIPCYNFHIYTDDIDKSSPNIIDLIEVKDIITFQCISDDYDFEYKEQYTNQINNKDELESFKEAVENEDLKLISIVTKEQFESMEYKVDD